MNLYAKYLKERENKEIIEKDYGFLVYKIFDKECFIADMFIVEEHRKTKAVGELIMLLNSIASINNCEVMTATIHLSDPGANRTLKASQKLDFKIIQANNNVIVIERKVT